MRTQADFQTRSIDRPELAVFVQSHHLADASTWPPRKPGLADLEAVALFYNSDIALSRRDLQLAEAGVVTAGERPNPTLSIAPEYIPNPSPDLAPWALGVSLDIPIETAGKRGHRIAQANHMVESAHIALAETVWKVRRDLRAALVAYAFDSREIELWRSEIALRESVVQLLEKRVEAGEASRFELNLAQTDLIQAKISASTAEGQLHQSAIAIAGIIGLPVTALANIMIDAGTLANPADPGSVPTHDGLHSAGLVNRIDIRKALADYAVAESGLRLEVAKQYPDVHLSPGYMNDQGEHRLSLGPSVTLPVLSQNKGPIAEAAAKRAQAAANFDLRQTAALNETDVALAAFQQSRRELDEINKTLAGVQKKTEQMTERALALGDSDRLAVATARLQTALLSRARLDAERKTQTALGALEDAVQRPLASPDVGLLSASSFANSLPSKP